MMRRKISRKTVKQLIVYFLIFCLLFNNSLSLVSAEPVNLVVVEGSAVFQQSGNTTTITTTTSQAIIKYDSFDVLYNEVANFVQPSSPSNVMNRINAARPTALDGTIMSNGGVYWLNPAGVIIGGGAVINVTKFVASALDMSNSDFMAGIDRFAGGQGAVINKGNINAQSVYLVAKQVLNTGKIISPKGHVVMAAGERVFISEPGSNIIVEIDSTAVEPDGGFLNLPLPDMANVTNEGTVEATGGKIILAAAGDAISSPMMANLGTLSTSVEEGDAGSISLRAVNGQLVNSGSITAENDSGTGGTVTAEGARVGNFGTINVDSAEGNGGSINLTADEVVVLGHESLTTANAGVNGDGGEIIAYSPDTALFREGALVEAKGGSESGDGGFFELSGKQYVEVEGQIDLKPVNGKNGHFLIDPRNVKIVDGSKNEGDWDGSEWDPDGKSGYAELGINKLEEFLDGADVTITTDGSTSGQSGWVEFAASRDLYDGTDHVTGSGYSLTVDADNSIKLYSGIYFTGGGDITLNGFNVIVSDGVNIEMSGSSTHGGNNNFTANALHGIKLGNGYVNVGGNLTLFADSDYRWGQDVMVYGQLTADGLVELEGTNVILYGDVESGGDMTIYAHGLYDKGASPEPLVAGGDVHVGGSLSAGAAGSINITAKEFDGTPVTVGPPDVDGVSGEYISNGTITLENNVIADSDITITGGVVNVGDGVGVDKVDSDGAVSITGTGTVTINAEIDPLSIIIDSEDDVIINNAELAENTISVSAGTDGAGSVYLNSGGSLTTNNPGTAIGITAADAITMVDGTEVNGGSGTITLLADDDIQISRLVTTEAVDVTSASGAITDNTVAEAANIIADQAALRAGSGIGVGEASNAGDIDTAINTLAAVTESGDIHIQNYGGLTIDGFDGLYGVTITDALTNDNGYGITIRTSSPLTVDRAVVNNDGGDITLAAEGGTADDDLGINANVTATGGDGNINLYAGDGIDAAAAVTISAEGTGTVLGMAGTDFADNSPANGTATGGLVMQDGSIIQSEDGDITLRAPGDVKLSIVNTNSNSDGTAGDVIVTADYDGIAGSLSNNIGSISDNLNGEAANIIADQAALRAGSGIGGSGGSADIETNISNLEAETATGGIYVTDIAGGLTIGGIGPMEGAQITAGSGTDHIEIVASSPLTVSELVKGHGDITLTAGDSVSAGDNLTLNDNVISTGTGTITLTAGDDIIQKAGFAVQVEGGGQITATADNEGDKGLDDDAVFTQADGAWFDSSGGPISVSSWGTASIAKLDAGTTGTVDVTSASGAINDASDDTSVDIIANVLTLIANNEIGGNPTTGKTTDTLGAIETDVSSLTAHSATGDIVIVEKDNVDLQDIWADAGSIFLEATDGEMTHVSGTIKAGASSLTMVQKKDLDLADFSFSNQGNTDLMAEVTDGLFTADNTKSDNAADKWKSIQAIAKDNIELQGEGDIKIGTHEGVKGGVKSRRVAV